MKILFVDTTTADLVVAVVEDKSIRDFSVESCGVKHSETLCNCVAKALSDCGLSFEDLDAYACAIGPGSFTGIRIGIATLKGYATAVCKPFISVCSLQAIALSKRCGSKLSAIIDAGNGYYYADYKRDVQPCLIAYDDEQACKAGRCEGGATGYLDGSVEIVRKSFREGKFDSEFVPLYIRRSQAEERK